MLNTGSQHLQMTLQLTHCSKGVRVTVATHILKRKELSITAPLLVFIWALSLIQEFICIISCHYFMVKKPAQCCPRLVGVCFPAGWGWTIFTAGRASGETDSISEQPRMKFRCGHLVAADQHKWKGNPLPTLQPLEVSKKSVLAFILLVSQALEGIG